MDFDLAEKMSDLAVDLIILEGMGRAIHTNFEANFNCDCIKTAVLKNKWLANRLGGAMFSCVFKFEKSKRIVAASNSLSNTNKAEVS